MADTPAGFVTLTSTERPEAEVTLRLDASVPTASGGFGGVQDITRPMRKPLTGWDGHTAKRLTIGVLMDGWAMGASIEQGIARLERLATADAGDDRPPLVKVAGNVPRGDLTWVIDDVSYGDAVWKGNVRVRQAVTITLTEYVVGKLLIVASTPYGGKPRLYRVRPTDNLKTIAARLLNDGNRWREIAKLNRLTTYKIPRARVGKLLKVPMR